MASTSNILAIDLKRTEHVPLTSALREYIANAYAELPDSYIDDLRILEELRNDAARLEIHQISLKRLIRYYAQLVFIGSKFPIDIGLSFPWYNAFGKELVEHQNLNFEKACVLFNIGAMYSQLGNSENRTSSEGLKKACQYFQYAAGSFQHLQDTVRGDLRCQPPSDISVPALNTLVNLMLAQAQECFWQKAVIDKLKDGIIAKLAGKVADFYDAAYDAATNTGCAGLFPQAWAVQMQVKGLHFNAVAQLRKSMECVSETKYGEEIARLRIADMLVKKALDAQKGLKSEAVVSDLRSLQTSIASNLTRAVKDNDLIYLVLVPASSTLPHIGRAEMVKASAPPEVSSPESSNSDGNSPLFTKLVPFAVHQAASVYTNRKERLLKDDIDGKFEKLTQLCQSSLQSLNLPMSLQAIEAPTGLPPSLLAKADTVRFEGGLPTLMQTLAAIKELHARDLTILNEAMGALSQEATEDDEHRANFKEKWQRPPSSELAKALLEQGSRHLDTLEAAKNLDAVVLRKLTEYSPIIEALGGSRQTLEETLPQTCAKTPEQDALISTLHGLLAETDKMRRRCKEQSEEARKLAMSDDIGPILMKATAELGTRSAGGIIRVDPSQFEGLFDEQLKKYDGFRKEVQKETEMQETLLKEITEANQNFVASRRTNATLQERDRGLQKLSIAYEKYKEISIHLQEGQKFYLQLEDVLTDFWKNCGDFCYARRMESRDYVNQLTASVTGMNLSGEPRANAATANPPPLPARPQTQTCNVGGWHPSMGLSYSTRGSVPLPLPPVQHRQQHEQQRPQQQYPVWNPNIPLQYGKPGAGHQ